MGQDDLGSVRLVTMQACTITKLCKNVKAYLSIIINAHLPPLLFVCMYILLCGAPFS